MVSPQKQNGYVGVANELWDEIIRRDFTKRQKDILLFILRLSYGCGQKAAFIPKQQDFTLCGLGGKGHVGTELKHLESCHVIIRNREKNEFALNKNYEIWNVQPVGGWDEERFKELVHLNITEAKKRKVEGVETASESYQNGNLDAESKLPKRELKVTKTGTFTKKKLLKRELRVTKTGTLTAFKRSDTKAFKSSKKGLKKKVIKKDLKDIVDSDECDNMFQAFWSAYPKKDGKAASQKKWGTYFKNGTIDFEKVMSGLERYKHFIEHERNVRKFDRAWMQGSTFVNQRHWESEWAIETFGKITHPHKQSLEEKSQREKQKIKEMLEHEGSRSEAVIFLDPSRV